MVLDKPEPDGERLEPSAAELIVSLRAFGYDLAMALADLIDNSISAEARSVRIAHCSDVGSAWVAVVDDGHGMEEQGLRAAMRFAHNAGAERTQSDLGRFGLGLKTASISQARRLTVLSRGSTGKLNACTWDIDHVILHREWLLLTELDQEAAEIAGMLGFTGTGTMVLWRKLDRLGEGPALSQGLAKAGKELSLLFHRYLETQRLVIEVAGRRLRPLDPYLRDHLATQDRGFEDLLNGESRIRVNPVVLPHPSELTKDESARASGPGGLMARQGFYVYRSDRLVVAGNWLNLGGMTSSVGTRLARVAVEIPQGADSHWEVDVMKSSVRPPTALVGRLLELAEDVRTRSERVFTHRGTRAAPPAGEQDIQAVWHQVHQRGGSRYVVNRQHPLVAMALAEAEGIRIEKMLRLVEMTVPVQAIVQETVMGSPPDTSNREQGVLSSQIAPTLREVLSSLPKDPARRTDLLEQLASAEPFCHHPGLIREFTELQVPEEEQKG